MRHDLMEAVDSTQTRQTASQPAPTATRQPAQTIDTPVSSPSPGSEALANAPASPREIMPPPAPSSFEAPAPPTEVAKQTRVKERETVGGQMKELLSKDSMYLEQGRQKGLEAMSQRGLQNSSFAIQAGEQARVASALPIAQQDAATYSNRAMLNQTEVNKFRLSTKNFVQSMIERAQQGNINSKLQFDQYGFSASLSAQDNIQRMEQLALAGDIDAKQKYIDFTYDVLMEDIEQGNRLELNDQTFQQSQTLLFEEFGYNSELSEQQSQQRIDEMNQGHQNTLDEIDAASNARIAEGEIGQGYNLQGQYLASVGTFYDNASDEIQVVMQTEGLTPAQQRSAIDSIWNRLDANIKGLQSFYTQSPQWDDDFSSFYGEQAIPVGIADPNPTYLDPLAQASTDLGIDDYR